ncbi:MAG: pitrilysin family protein, partial [Pseudomonadota bacterium]
MASRILAPATAALIAFGSIGLTAAQAESGSGFGANVTTFALENGLDVVVVPDHRAPVVTHMVWYRVGAADEPAGVSGIAHFLEHLMFKGTEANPDGRFSKIVAEIGGQENAFTGQDFTAYFQRVAREHLPLVMSLEADRMSNLRLTDEVVAPERDVILEERRSRIDNNPGARLSEAMSAAMFTNHPYRVPIIGWRHEMEELSREDAIAFYDRFYTPNNAILVVAGDVEADDVRLLAEEHYGSIERRADPGDRMRVDEPEPIAPRRVELADPRVEQESWRRNYLVPSALSAENGEGEALEVLAEIFGGGPTSRLYRDLVRKGIAAGAGAYYQGSSMDETVLGLYASPADGVSLEELEAAMDEALADFLDSEVTQAEIDRVVNALTAEAIYAQDSQTSLARMYGAALATGSSVEEVNAWPDELAKVTPEAVKAVAEKYLQLPRSVTG